MVNFRFEPTSYMISTGLIELSARHWNEAGIDKDLLEHDPDWVRYGRMEDSNILRWVAARDGDELIGYASLIMSTHIHDKKVCTALISDLFIMPEKRAGGTADKLMDFLEKQLMNIGVQYITIGVRLQFGIAGRWLRRRGYNCHEHLHTKTLAAKMIH